MKLRNVTLLVALNCAFTFAQQCQGGNTLTKETSPAPAPTKTQASTSIKSGPVQETSTPNRVISPPPKSSGSINATSSSGGNLSITPIKTISTPSFEPRLSFQTTTANSTAPILNAVTAGKTQQPSIWNSSPNSFAPAHTATTTPASTTPNGVGSKQPVFGPQPVATSSAWKTATANGQSSSVPFATATQNISSSHTQSTGSSIVSPTGQKPVSEIQPASGTLFSPLSHPVTYPAAPAPAYTYPSQTAVVSPFQNGPNLNSAVAHSTPPAAAVRQSSSTYSPPATPQTPTISTSGKSGIPVYISKPSSTVVGVGPPVTTQKEAQGQNAPTPNIVPSVNQPLSPVPVGQVFRNVYGAQCTAYAATRFDAAADIQDSQRSFKTTDAKDWYVAAQKNWVTESKEFAKPPPGSIAVYDDSVSINGKQVWSGEGHVAVVEQVRNGGIEFSEQNWSKAPGVTVTQMNASSYGSRQGADWKTMANEPSPQITKAQAEQFTAMGIQHDYKLVGFILPEQK